MQRNKRRIFSTVKQALDSKLVNWSFEVTVKLITVIILVITFITGAEPVAQQLEATFNIELPPLTLENKIEVMIVLPEGEALPLEFSAEQMAAILAAMESR